MLKFHIRAHSMRDTNHFVATILESITDAFFAFDYEWCFPYVNHRAELLLQRAREALLGQSIWVEAERASAEAHARQVDAMLANMSEGIIIADAQGNVLQMNAVVAQIHNYNQPQEFQRNLTEFPDTFELYSTDGRFIPVSDITARSRLRASEAKGLYFLSRCPCSRKSRKQKRPKHKKTYLEVTTCRNVF